MLAIFIELKASNFLKLAPAFIRGQECVQDSNPLSY